MPRAPQEKRFTLDGFTYAAKLWGEADQTPVIALHGWLDNSASFDVLAPQLDNVQCLAVDLAGHGLSDHRVGLVDYPIWSEIAAIYAIADQMGWSRFALLGHSRGAMMSFLAAGIYPERITSLILIDSIVPTVITSEQVTERVVKSIEEIQRRVHRPLSLYSTYDDALKARCLSRFAPVGRQTAQLLASRGLREVEGQYHWHADGKIWAASNIALTHEMVLAFAQKIADQRIPTSLILADQGLIEMTGAAPEFVRGCRQVSQKIEAQEVVVSGGHFLHMEQGQEEVVAHINEIFADSLIAAEA